MVYVIQDCDELKLKTSLSVHILGSTFVESYILTILDIFFLWLENVECLNLVFVGPDCPPPDEDFINSVYEKHSDKKLTINLCSGVFYHEMFLGSQDVTNPDIIVAFNCGFHEFRGQNCDTWEKTIQFILTLENTILVSTSYTLKEAEDDSQPFIEQDKVDILKLCQNNPFKSLNPHRNPERSESAIFFFNQFLSVFKIKNEP
uniref:Zinc finger MYND domain-containing protein 17 n=1 Tax=Lygus hesperus TaxID=30085 RepID=A0A0A9W5X8_LYGHE